MEVKISGIYAVAYYNNLSKKIDIYPKLFIDKEEATKFAKDNNGVIQSVFL